MRRTNNKLNPHIAFFLSSSSLCHIVRSQLKVANVDKITNKCRSRINAAQPSKKKSKTLDLTHLSIFTNDSLSLFSVRIKENE